MPKKCLQFCLIALAAACPAYCSPLIPIQWYSGLWNPSNQTLPNDSAYVGSLGTPVADRGPAPRTFNNPVLWALIITDLNKVGDSFDGFDNNVLLGPTFSSTDDRFHCGNDPLGCIAPK